MTTKNYIALFLSFMLLLVFMFGLPFALSLTKEIDFYCAFFVTFCIILTVVLFVLFMFIIVNLWCD